MGFQEGRQHIDDFVTFVPLPSNGLMSSSGEREFRGGNTTAAEPEVAAALSSSQAWCLGPHWERTGASFPCGNCCVVLGDPLAVASCNRALWVHYGTSQGSELQMECWVFKGFRSKDAPASRTCYPIRKKGKKNVQSATIYVRRTP
jgi:hypothetical protein